MTLQDREAHTLQGTRLGNMTSLPQVQIATEVAQCCSADVEQYLGSKIKRFAMHALPAIRLQQYDYANVSARLKLIDSSK